MTNTSDIYIKMGGLTVMKTSVWSPVILLLMLIVMTHGQDAEVDAADRRVASPQQGANGKNNVGHAGVSHQLD